MSFNFVLENLFRDSEWRQITLLLSLQIRFLKYAIYLIKPKYLFWKKQNKTKTKKEEEKTTDKQTNFVLISLMTSPNEWNIFKKDTMNAVYG